MGASTFSTTVSGPTADQAFEYARNEALYDYGHRGYTGTIAEKNSFTMIPLPPGKDVYEFIDDLIFGNDSRVNEAHYNATYVGYYDIPTRPGLHVFYQTNPRTDLGHSEYFGLFIHPLTDQLYICNAKSITEAKYPAIKFPDDTIICSRYRHDYVTYGDGFLDGGLDYTRYSPHRPPNGFIQIIDGKEVFHATHSG